MNNVSYVLCWCRCLKKIFFMLSFIFFLCFLKIYWNSSRLCFNLLPLSRHCYSNFLIGVFFFGSYCVVFVWLNIMLKFRQLNPLFLVLLLAVWSVRIIFPCLLPLIFIICIWFSAPFSSCLMMNWAIDGYLFRCMSACWRRSLIILVIAWMPSLMNAL